MPTVTVFYGNAPIAENVPQDPAAAEDRPDAASFLPLAEPPPFGTILRLDPGGAVRVVEVIEATHGTQRKGVFVTAATNAQIEAADALPTTRLAPKPAAPGDDATAAPRSDAAPEGYAVPAPVLEPEPSEAVDVGRHGDPDGTASDAQSAQSPEAPGRRTKKRKGRRRS